jgi:hypothetical protein
MTNGGKLQLEQAIYDLIQMIYDTSRPLKILEDQLQQEWEERGEVSDYLVEQSLQARATAINSFIDQYKRRQEAH